MSVNATLPTSDVGIATDFVIKLVQLGFIGLAGLLFVLSFLILWKNQQADEGMAKFRMAFLIIGFLSVLVSAGVQILPSKATTSVTFSPDLGVAGLSVPGIRLLPTGSAVNPDQEFTLPSGATIAIRADKLLAEAKQLQATSQQLTQVATTLAAAEPAQPAQAEQVEQLSTEVSDNLKEGKFDAARISAIRLNEFSARIVARQ